MGIQSRSFDSLPSAKFPEIGNTADLTLDSSPREFDGQYGKVFIFEGVAGDAFSAPVNDGTGQRAVKPGERVALWARAGQMTQALIAALEAAEATQREPDGSYSLANFVPGGRLQMRFKGEDQNFSKAGNALKLYAAKYEPPQAAVAAASIAEDEWA